MVKEKLKKEGSVSRQGVGGGQPLSFSSPEELEEKIQNYFDEARDEKRWVTFVGLCRAIGADRQTLNRYIKAEEIGWLKRISSEEREKYSHVIKDAKQYIEMIYEERLFENGTFKGSKFALMNHYGWKDQQEIVNTNTNTELTEEEIKNQLAELGIEN